LIHFYKRLSENDEVCPNIRSLVHLLRNSHASVGLSPVWRLSDGKVAGPIADTSQGALGRIPRFSRLTSRSSATWWGSIGNGRASKTHLGQKPLVRQQISRQQELWILDHSFKQGWKLEEEVETCTKGELENAEYPLTYDLHWCKQVFRAKGFIKMLNLKWWWHFVNKSSDWIEFWTN